VRPVYFMENLTGRATQDTDDGLALMTPLESATLLRMIAMDDIAAIVGVVFAQPECHIGKAFDIAGDELTMSDAARRQPAACLGDGDCAAGPPGA
jgi:hypothetical protein